MPPLTPSTINPPPPTDPNAREAAMRQGMSMLLLVSIIGVSIVTLLLVSVQRRKRHRRKTERHMPTGNHPELDPWTESSRRMDDGSFAEFRMDD